MPDCAGPILRKLEAKMQMQIIICFTEKTQNKFN